MVKSAKHQELKVAQLSSRSPGEGCFTVDADRKRVGAARMAENPLKRRCFGRDLI